MLSSDGTTVVTYSIPTLAAHFITLWPWPLTCWPQGQCTRCRGSATCTKFGADSSTCFSFRARTHRQTYTQLCVSWRCVYERKIRGQGHSVMKCAARDQMESSMNVPTGLVLCQAGCATKQAPAVNHHWLSNIRSSRSSIAPSWHFYTLPMACWFGLIYMYAYLVIYPR